MKGAQLLPAALVLSEPSETPKERSLVVHDSFDNARAHSRTHCGHRGGCGRMMAKQPYKESTPLRHRSYLKYLDGEGLFVDS